MKKKIFIFTFWLMVLTNCGFSPIYKNMKDLNFGISVIGISGDREMYNLIKSNLNKYANIDNSNIFKITINTNYSKNILAKDSTGKTTDYQIKVISNFKIEQKEFTKNISIEETFDYKKIEDLFEEKKYEETIKQNISDITTRKLISQLTRLQ